jgi:hypothetical protein
MICRPKDQGGLGAEVLEIKRNLAFLANGYLSFFLRRFMVAIVKNKYLSQKILADVETKPTDSPF